MLKSQGRLVACGACIAWAFLNLLYPTIGRGADTPAPPGPASGTGRGEPDLSTPGKALTFFVNSLEKGDAAGLRAVVTGDEKQLEWVRAEAAQWSALRDLESALAKRYGAGYAAGDKGKEAKERIAEARDADLHDDLTKAKLAAAKDGEAKADEVMVVLDEAAPDSHQGRLVRVEGRWKFDLGSLSDYLVPDDVPVLKAVGAAAANLARDVSAGKFAALDEAAEAIDERLNAAVETSAPKKKPEPPPVAPAEPRRRPNPAAK